MSDAAEVRDATGHDAQSLAPHAATEARNDGLEARAGVASGSPRARLLALAADERSGELIVALGEETARIHIDGGRIAWVHRPRHRPSLRDILGLDAATIDDATVRTIVERSYASRRHFADVAVEMAVRTASDVRACLVSHLRRELAAVLGWAGARTTFIEEERTSRAAFDFALDELMPDGVEDDLSADDPRDLGLDLVALPPASVAPANDGVAEARAEALVRRVAALPDLSGHCVLDTRRGAAIVAHGTLAGDDELVRSLARALASLGGGADEIIAARRGSAFLVRASAADPSLVVVVELDPKVMVPGLARILVADATKA